MCRPRTCRTCQRTTWAGCGQHVAQVRAMVPDDQWCDGVHDDQNGPRSGGFLARLLGR